MADKLFETDGTAAALIPENPSLETLREAATGCSACDLWKTGTQTVFGEGSPDAKIEEAGIDRKLAYVTNVVKHFKWQPRGKRRIHRPRRRAARRPGGPGGPPLRRPRRPAARHRPREFRVSRDRGVPVESELAPVVMATVHPSAILRSDDRERELGLFVEDLRRVAEVEALRAA